MSAKGELGLVLREFLEESGALRFTVLGAADDSEPPRPSPEARASLIKSIERRRRDTRTWAWTIMALEIALLVVLLLVVWRVQYDPVLLSTALVGGGGGAAFATVKLRRAWIEKTLIEFLLDAVPSLSPQEVVRVVLVLYHSSRFESVMRRPATD